MTEKVKKEQGRNVEAAFPDRSSRYESTKEIIVPS